MVDTKKAQERDEFHHAIWAIADELCGAVDGWDFKNYVLGLTVGLGWYGRQNNINKVYDIIKSPKKVYYSFLNAYRL